MLGGKIRVTYKNVNVRCMILLLNVFLYEEVPVIANFNSPPLIRTLTVLDNQRNYFSY